MNPLPQQAETYLKAGDELLLRRSYARARKQYRKALAASRAHAPLYVRLGETYLHSRRANVQEALGWFRRAADLKPTFPEAHYLCGVANSEMGKFEDAVESYRTAARLAPSDPRPWTGAGLCLIRLRQFPAAISALREALRLKPHYGEASVHLWLADALRGNKQLRAACEQWKIVLELEPGYPDYDGPMKEARELLKRHCRGTEAGNSRSRRKRA